MTFTFPLAFWGLLAIPALVAIYVLRNRFRRQPVSSLLLWLLAPESRAGGTRIRRLQTPLFFFLELLALLLLVLAAANPHLPLAEGNRPLLVVLDDSFSMQAGGDESPRQRGLTAVMDLLGKRDFSSVRFLLAGDRPQVLGPSVTTAVEARAQLEGWRCQGRTAALAESLGLASELGGTYALLLVVTDAMPEDVEVPEKGRVRWWAFGRPRANLAFVNAARTAREADERCLLELANLFGEPRRATVVVEREDGGEPLRRETIELGPGKTHRLILRLPEATPALRAGVEEEDDLPADSSVLLLPARQPEVGVDVRVEDEELRTLVDRALGSLRGVKRTGSRPDLVFTDKEEEASGRTWVLRLVRDEKAKAYTGPFVLDRSHPLAEGLSLQGVVWGAGKSEETTGQPVVMAGNVPLLTDVEGADDRHALHLHLRPDLSTLPESPNWPILIANLIHWRVSLLPGLEPANVRLGGEVTLTLPLPSPGEETPAEARLIRPDGEESALVIEGRRVVAPGNVMGIHEIRVEDETHRFAVNALTREESDLTDRGEGKAGDWLDETTLRLEYRSVAWVLLLALLGVVTLHLWLVARAGGRSAT
jgi:hypothetical protein